MFITFEGLDGSGKSTQASLLASALPGSLLTREPGGTRFAEGLRSLAFEFLPEIDGEVQALCYTAARLHHIRQVILPTLASARDVICDRYFDSTQAYQGYGGGTSLDKINLLQEHFSHLMPDLTFVIDVPLEVARKRRPNIQGSYEKFNDSFHERVKEGFLKIAHSNPNRCFLLDGTKDEKEVHALVIKILSDFRARRVN